MYTQNFLGVGIFVKEPSGDLLDRRRCSINFEIVATLHELQLRLA